MGAQFPIGAQVTANTQGFVSGISGASRSLTSFRGATAAAAVGLAAFVGAKGIAGAVDAAADFQTAFTEINVLTGTSVDLLAEWREELLRLAPELGQTPRELAGGLMAVTSAGIRGREAMDVLVQSAKAAALGLGDTKTIARTTAAAVQAFASQNLTAAEAVDILVGIVREGNAEANEIAPTLGRVMGIAAQLGLTFQQVGAFIATFSRLGVDAAEAVTALRGTLTTVIKPTVEGREALQEMGTSVDELRASIRERGLTTTLIELIQSMDGNLDVLGKVIPNVRALSGVLGTAGVQSEAFVQVQEEINNILGVTNQGFETYKQTAQAAFDEFGAAIETLQIEFGKNFLPSVTAGIRTLTDHLDGLVTALTGLIAASVVQGISRLITALRALSIAGRGLGFLGGPVVGTLTLIAGALPLVIGLFRDANEEVEEFNKQLDEEMARVAQHSSESLLELKKSLEEAIAAREEALLTGAPSSQVDILEREKKRLEAINAELERRQQVTGVGITLTRDHASAVGEMDEKTASLVARLRQERDELKFSGIALVRLTEGYRKADEDTKNFIENLVEEIQEREVLNQIEKEARQEKERLSEATNQLIEDLELETVRVSRSREELVHQSEAYKSATTEQKAYIDFLLKEIELHEKNQEETAKHREELSQLKREAGRMADELAQALIDIAFEAENTREILGDLFASLARDIASLTLRKTITEPLSNALASALTSLVGGGGGAATTAGSAFGGFIPAGSPRRVGELGSEIVVPLAPSAVVPTSGPRSGAFAQEAGLSSAPTTVFRQTVHLSPQLINGRDGRRWLNENRGEIMRIVASGISESDLFRRTMGRG